MRSGNSGDLLSDLTTAINHNSAENGSDTPDYVLGKFLTQALEAFDCAVRTRDRHYGTGSASDELVKASIVWLQAREDPSVSGRRFTQACDDLADAVTRLKASPVAEIAMENETGNDSLETARCTSCDHEICMHFDPEGCRFTIETGRPGRDLVCPCSVYPPVDTLIERRDPQFWTTDVDDAISRFIYEGHMEDPDITHFGDRRRLAAYLVDALRLREMQLQHEAALQVQQKRTNVVSAQLQTLRSHIHATVMDASVSDFLTARDVVLRLRAILEAEAGDQ